LWFIRSIVVIIGIVAIVWLGTKNAGTKVSFYLFTKTFENVELNLILVVTFITGMLFWAVFSWIKEAQLRLGLRRANKKIQSLEEEVSALRNLPLEEGSEEKEESEEI